MDEEASMLVRMINNSIESSYGVPNFFQPQILIRIMNGNIPSPVFFLKIMGEIENSMSFITQYMDGPKPDSNNLVLQFKSYVSDQRKTINPKIFSLFDELWQNGTIQTILPIIYLPQKNLDLYTWLMDLRIDSPIYEGFFKSFQGCKTLKDVVLAEFKKSRDLMSRQSNLMKIKDLYSNLDLKKFELSERILISLINEDPLVPIFWMIACVIYTGLNNQNKALACIRVAVALNQYDNQNWMISLGIIQKNKGKKEINSNPPWEQGKEPLIKDLIHSPAVKFEKDPRITPGIVKNVKTFSQIVDPMIILAMNKKELPYSISTARLFNSTSFKRSIVSDPRIKKDNKMAENILHINPFRSAYDAIQYNLRVTKHDKSFSRKLTEFWQKGYYSRILYYLLLPISRGVQSFRAFQWILDLDLRDPFYKKIFRKNLKDKIARELVLNELLVSTEYPKKGVIPQMVPYMNAMKIGNFEEAFDLTSKSIKQDPLVSFEWIDLADWYNRMGDPDSAKKALRFALVTEHYFKPAWLQISFLPDNVNKSQKR